MSITLKHLDFPSDDPTHFVHILSSLLSEEECAEIIKSHTNLVRSNLTLGTIRTREEFKDRALVALLWSRMKPFYASNRIKDDEGYWWKAKGLNKNLRLSKYEKGNGQCARYKPKFKILIEYRRKIHSPL